MLEPLVPWNVMSRNAQDVQGRYARISHDFSAIFPSPFLMFHRTTISYLSIRTQYFSSLVLPTSNARMCFLCWITRLFIACVPRVLGDKTQASPGKLQGILPTRLWLRLFNAMLLCNSVHGSSIFHVARNGTWCIVVAFLDSGLIR